MSCYAISSITHEYVYANEPHLFGRQDLVCPSCGCAMSYVSPQSNARAAHFRGKHFPGCDIGTASSKDVDPYNYSLAGNSVQGLLDRLLKDGVKKPSSENGSSASHGSSTGVVHNKTIKTIRQLFDFCVSVDPKTCLPDGTLVQDIYCGPSTQKGYSQNVFGLHLMYAQYSGSTKNDPALFFGFPSLAEQQLCIAVKSEIPGLLDQIEEQFSKGDYGLIFGVFNRKRCFVTSPTQVVPIKSGRKTNHVAKIR